MSQLAICAPTEVAIASFPQVRLRDRLETARRVEARGEFIRDRPIVDKTVCLSRPDRRFVELFRVENSALDSRNFRADQRGSIFEVCRAMLGPYLELLMVVDQGGKMPLPFFRESTCLRSHHLNYGMWS